MEFRVLAPATCLIVSLAVSGCMNTFNPYSTERLQANFTGTPEERKMTEAELMTRIGNRTRLSISRSHGAQVSYATADGKIFLWYPGNAKILEGKWRLEKRNLTVNGSPVEYTAICFQYGADTFNPATGSRGANWECSAAGQLVNRAAEAADGDIFELSKRQQSPMILNRDAKSFADIRARMGRV